MADVLLVTGANSFVAGQVIKLALEKGFTVRGTVRSDESGKKLLATFPTYSQGSDARLTYHLVPDITKVENYASCFDGSQVTGVVHTASPFNFHVKDIGRELLEPARDGSVAILEAAQRYGGGKVRSVVSMSSFAAAVAMEKSLTLGYVYTEADWNPLSWEDGLTAPAVVAYTVSKTVAEQAMWDWIEAHKGKEGASFALTTMLPPWVFGPYVDAAAMGVTTPAKLTESLQLLVHLVDGDHSAVPPPNDIPSCCDVRDLARAILASYEKAGAGDPTVANQRFLLGVKFSYPAAIDAIRQAFPQLADKLPGDAAGAGLTEPTFSLNSSKAEKALGIAFTPMDDTVKDSVRQILAVL